MPKKEVIYTVGIKPISGEISYRRVDGTTFVAIFPDSLEVDEDSEFENKVFKGAQRTVTNYFLENEKPAVLKLAENIHVRPRTYDYKISFSKMTEKELTDLLVVSFKQDTLAETINTGIHIDEVIHRFYNGIPDYQTGYTFIHKGQKATVVKRFGDFLFLCPVGKDNSVTLENDDNPGFIRRPVIAKIHQIEPV